MASRLKEEKWKRTEILLEESELQMIKDLKEIHYTKNTAVILRHCIRVAHTKEVK